MPRLDSWAELSFGAQGRCALDISTGHSLLPWGEGGINFTTEVPPSCSVKLPSAAQNSFLPPFHRRGGEVDNTEQPRAPRRATLLRGAPQVSQAPHSPRSTRPPISQSFQSDQGWSYTRYNPAVLGKAASLSAAVCVWWLELPAHHATLVSRPRKPVS